ncbi:hypothetical protein MASR2M117_02590 [Paludibacter sp.]
MKIIELRTFSPRYLQAIQSLTMELLNEPYELSEAYLQEIVESENSHLFLLLEEEVVMGMLTVAIYKTPTGIRAWIEDVAVDKQARGRGYGRQLMLHAIDFAKAMSASTLMLTSRPARVAANKLYQSLGFEQKETNVYHMRL